MHRASIGSRYCLIVRSAVSGLATLFFSKTLFHRNSHKLDKSGKFSRKFFDSTFIVTDELICKQIQNNRYLFIYAAEKTLIFQRYSHLNFRFTYVKNIYPCSTMQHRNDGVLYQSVYNSI